MHLQYQTAEVFKPFKEPSRYKGAYGGRGSGKSHYFATAIVRRAIVKPGSRMVCVREVQKSLRESVKLLIEDKIEELGVGALFNILHDRIETPGNGVIMFQGMQDHTKESIKSLEGFSAYVEEAQTMTSGSLEMLRPTIRAKDTELWFSWNPRNASDPVDRFFRGPEPAPGTILVKANYMDNPFLPPALELERQHDYNTKPDRYAHIWLGEYEPQALGAIWTRQGIADGRFKYEDMPEMKRIVVAIDPALGSDKNGNDEQGIIVVGEGIDDRGYVLDDLSFHGTPEQWARVSFAAYDAWEADAFVVEINAGGEMVKHTLRSVRQGAMIYEVRATRGKHVRAEPISALYGLGRISHVGSYPELENQMCLMTAGGYEGDGSPDRVDAMVWGFTHLFPRLVTKTDDQNRPTRANSGYSPHRPRMQRH